MKTTPTSIPEVLVLEPKVFGDARGFFMESFNQKLFNQAVGREVHFVQDNHSRSSRGVLRGLHYQLHEPQGKLVRVSLGRVFDVAVDLRRGSSTFGRSVGVELSGENNRQLWIPPGFAHGFLVLSETADFQYKTTSYYHPDSERSIMWNSDEIKIEWPLDGLQIVQSDRDSKAPDFSKAEYFS